ncbi:MAG: four helix bundle protein [Bacteroidota bacterium]
MKKDNVVLEKSYAFAIRIVRLSKHLREECHEYVLSKQILKSGTSVGANLEEAVGAQSRKDFLSKMQIAYKEARETHYWLRLLRDTDSVPCDMLTSLLFECEELIRLTGSIASTTRATLEKKD